METVHLVHNESSLQVVASLIKNISKGNYAMSL